MKNFSKMYCKTLNLPPHMGIKEGDCCICGEHTYYGNKKRFGGNFTCADYLQNGEVICPYCYHVFKGSNSLRRTMFYLSDDEFIKFKKKDAKDIILNLPDKPFYLYLTRTWQKTGWVRLNEAYNTTNKGNINFLMDYDIIRTDINTLKDTCETIRNLRDLKIPKKNLEEGQLELYHFKKISEKYGTREARHVNEMIKFNAHNPIWGLAVYLEG